LSYFSILHLTGTPFLSFRLPENSYHQGSIKLPHILAIFFIIVKLCYFKQNLWVYFEFVREGWVSRFAELLFEVD
jgi:hypothetical protein